MVEGDVGREARWGVEGRIGREDIGEAGDGGGVDGIGRDGAERGRGRRTGGEEHPWGEASRCPRTESPRAGDHGVGVKRTRPPDVATVAHRGPGLMVAAR